ncbi:hypothetical protein AVEN_42122-1 [Araneus ventricosus]|uniref:Uncharacterized protein n=1 Tax=Araneus ventricosus TaxID=182803 RepID=A0A4Y2D2E4_ARAVE|nr:hypothetical protein AVEN_42122-1 [Araneus ventricosus]
MTTERRHLLSIVNQWNDLCRRRFRTLCANLHIHGGSKALFQRRVAWTNLELLEVRKCGLWSVKFEQSRRSYGAWLCKYLGRARVNGCNGAFWSFEERDIYRHDARNHICTYKSTSHNDSSRSDDRQ